MLTKPTLGEKSPTKFYSVLKDIEETIILSLIVMGLILPLAVPTTPLDAHHYSDPVLEYDLTWVSDILPDEPHLVKYHTYHISITQEDWDSQATLPYFRYQSWYSPSCSILIDENNTYVKAIAEYIQSLSPNPYLDIVNAHRFVNSLQYTTDLYNYGIEEYWATPIETLAHRGGDCEDLAVLLASLYCAMDISCALLYYPAHCSVAVYYQDNLYPMDPTATYPTGVYLQSTDLTYMGYKPEIIKPCDKKWIADVSRDLALYRYWIRDSFGI